jgi:hypothetical protein
VRIRADDVGEIGGDQPITVEGSIQFAVRFESGHREVVPAGGESVCGVPGDDDLGVRLDRDPVGH